MVGSLKPGTIVEVECGGKTYTGTVMPRPELTGEGYLTLKLGSGYDIGLRESDIGSVKVLGEAEASPAPKRRAVEPDPSKRTVTILSTGGTIASRLDYRTGGVYASSNAEDLVSVVPELAGLANIRADSVMNVMSEDMNPTLWAKMGEAAAKALNGGSDGVVITHGTDTMGYSAAALSFMLGGLGKPVVLTGAQKSSDRGSTDAILNLLCSVTFAGSDYAGVYVVMHAGGGDDCCYAHLGTKVRKMHTTRRDAFRSINAAPAARVYQDGRVEALGGGLRPRTGGTVKADSGFQEKVALVKVYPGFDPGVFEYHLGRGVRGVVIEGTALGHVPTPAIPAIEKLLGAGVLVAMTTQSLYGRVNPYVYSNLRELSSRGVVYCEDMLPETAYVKLMWALGKADGVDEAKALMLESVAGEITDRSVPGDAETGFD